MAIFSKKLLVLSLIIIFAFHHAGAQSFDYFHINAELKDDGFLRVKTEFRFPDKAGLLPRVMPYFIPLKVKDEDKFREYELGSVLVFENTCDGPIERHYMDENFDLLCGSHDSIYVVELEYDLNGVVKSNEGEKESYSFHWYAFKNIWGFPIKDFRLSIKIPDTAKTGNLEVFNSQTNELFAKEDYEVRTDIPGEILLTVKNLPKGQSIVLSTQLSNLRILGVTESTLLNTIDSFESWSYYKPIHPIFYGFFSSGILLFILWNIFGKDKDHRAVFARHEQPSGISPAMAYLFNKYRATPEAIASAILNLAGKKRIEIVKHEQNFHMTKISDDTDGLSHEEAAIFKSAFKDSNDFHIRNINWPRLRSMILSNMNYLNKEFSKKYLTRNIQYVIISAIPFLLSVGFSISIISDDLGPIFFGVMLFETIIIGTLIYIPLFTNVSRQGRRIMRLIMFMIFVSTILNFLIDPASYVRIMIVVYYLFLLIFMYSIQWMKAFNKVGKEKLNDILGYEKYLKTVEKERFKKLTMKENFEYMKDSIGYFPIIGLSNDWIETLKEVLAQYSLPYEKNNLTGHYRVKRKKSS